jgi:hypothetical protein
VYLHTHTHTTRRTLAIQVGIGIFGKEGRQAANSADIAIPQFKNLFRVMQYHGGFALWQGGGARCGLRPFVFAARLL